MTDSLVIENISAWNTSFFKRFIGVQHRAQIENKSSLQETLGEHKKFFGIDSSFSQKNDWCLWILRVNGQDVARLGCTHPKNGQSLAYLSVGYYESLPNVKIEHLKSLFQKAENFARVRMLNEIHFPFQGGFFGSYRARLTFKSAPYLTEPETLPRYLHEWEQIGLHLLKTWSNFEVDVEQMKLNSEKTLNRFYGSTQNHGVTSQLFDLRQLDRELLRLRSLFLDSYKDFESFSSVSEKEFLEIYRPYGFLFEKYFCSFLIQNGVDVGFALSFPDILGLLLFFQKYKIPGALQKIIAFFYLKFTNPRLFFPYAGKRADAAPIKGFLAIAFLHAIKKIPRSMKTMSFQYIASGSLSKKSFSSDFSTETSQFGIFKKVVGAHGSPIKKD